MSFYIFYSKGLSTQTDVRACRSWLLSLRDGCLLAKYREMVRYFIHLSIFLSDPKTFVLIGSSERDEEKTRKRSDGTRDR